VAKRALVSLATAYRYFPSMEASIRETAADRDMKPLERIWQPGDDPVKSIGLRANALNKLLIDDEIGLHLMMERSFISVWLESESYEPLRPGRRMSYIEPIVDSLKDVLALRANG
jgi:AcrR family transcriptional regulator